MVAGALQDHDRAAVVGTTTLGRGGQQTRFPVAGGGALQLTTTRWYTPSGRSITRPPAPGADEDGGADDDGDAPAKDSLARRPRFKTDGGRTVVGAGGIAPDVVAGDTAGALAELTLVRAFGTKIGALRDAAAAYAATPAGRTLGARPGFVVPPTARDAVFRLLTARGTATPRSTFDAAGPFVDRQIGYELARRWNSAAGPSAARADSLARARAAAADSARP